MFILVVYKDAPEISLFLWRSGSQIDQSVEKTLLVNPKCLVRVMLEYIRKKCKLGQTTHFDLADQNGALKGLFDLPTFAYAHELFEHKKTYYLVVLTLDPLVILPQLNHDNVFYSPLQTAVKKYLKDSNTTSTTTPSTASKNKPDSKDKQKEKAKGKKS